MPSSRQPGRRGFIALAPIALGACNQARVRVDEAYAGPRLPRPTRVQVRDFAVSPTDVTLDQGLRGRAMELFSSASDQRLTAARATSAALAEALAKSLAGSGLPVDRLPPGNMPEPGGVVVDGRLLSVDEGNRTQRTMIGFGRGKSSLVAEAKLYVLEAGGATRQLEAFTTEADSGNAPGMAVTMGAGRLAGRLASSAELGAGAHGAIEGSQADDTAEARKIGSALGEQIKRFFAQQGWTR